MSIYKESGPIKPIACAPEVSAGIAGGDVVHFSRMFRQIVVYSCNLHYNRSTGCVFIYSS